MKILKFKLTKASRQFVKMPEKSEIMDIQLQEGEFVMWALCPVDNPEIKVQINIYGTGWDVNENMSKNEYLATVQSGGFVWHFFMNYEV